MRTVASEPRGVQDRPGHLLQGRFDLGVADQADARGARRPMGQQRERRAEHERQSPARSVSRTLNCRRPARARAAVHPFGTLHRCLAVPASVVTEPSDMDITDRMTTTSLGDRLKIAARSQIAPFIAMDVLARANGHAAAGRDDNPPRGRRARRRAPARARAGGRAAALEGGRIGYTEALGRLALRAAIAEHYRRSYDLALDPEQVVVTVGASGAFVLGFLAMFDPGDRVIVPEPAFPAYKNILRALGIEVVRIGLDAASDFKPTVAMLQAVPPPVHGLIVASPANPTGTMLDRAELAALAAFCRARGIRVIADEIYHGITYDRPASTVLELDPDAVVINGFSKYFA